MFLEKEKLEEGVILQYWNNNSNLKWTQMKAEFKKYINNQVANGSEGGHSIIFKSYQYNEFGNIIGLRYYDYGGTNKASLTLEESVFYRNSKPIILLGANLLEE